MSITGLWENGYSGGRGGGEFADITLPSKSRVHRVEIRSGALIDAVNIIHEISPGNEIDFPHGGTGGVHHTFTLAPNEHITKIEGKYGVYVDSMTIFTDAPRNSPTYGGPGGDANYKYEAPKGTEIAGFYGRSGVYIDAIGVVYRKIQ